MTETENYFDIDTTQDYHCNVFRYSSRLSRLYIRVFKSGSDAPSFYLFFPDVGYFEGPMNWQGAVFHKAPANECLDLMVRAGLVQNIMLDDPETRAALAESVHLYRVKTSSEVTVRIIAGDASKLDDVPDDMN